MDSDFAEIIVPMPWGHVSGRWYGDQRQRPLIAVHGWLDNCGTFARLAPLLQPYTSLLCIDFPGHGYSTHMPVGILYSAMEFVRVLLRLMKAYKWQKVSLLGHSMGGVVTFTFAALFPDRVDMLIQLDILLECLTDAEYLMAGIRYTIERAVRDNERILQQTPMHGPPSYAYEECERLLYEGTNYSVWLQNCKYLLERNLGKSPIYPKKYFFSRDSRLKYMLPIQFSKELAQVMISRIGRTGIPHLVVRGGASPNVSEHTLANIVPMCESRNVNFELHTVPDGTHHVHLNNPTEVSNIIIDFWTRKSWLQKKDAKVDDVNKSEEAFKSKL